jgi:hypothetical protein
MDPEYERAANRYLLFTAAACLIASIHIGPIALVVWVVTAIVMRQAGTQMFNRPPPRPPKTSCQNKRRRRR